MIAYVLGSMGSIQDREASNTSLAVTSEGRTLLIDVSGSPIQALKRSGLDALSLDALLLTHAHIDHIYALPSLIHQMWLMGRKEDLTIIANGPTIEVAQRLYDLFSLSEKKGIFAVNWQTAEQGGAVAQIGAMSVSLVAVDHGIPTFGCVLEEGDRKIVYLADCRIGDAYPSCTFDADLLIHEAGGLADSEMQLAAGGHSSARQAAMTAHRLRARRLVLVHLPCIETVQRQMLTEAQARCASSELPRLFEPYYV